MLATMPSDQMTEVLNRDRRVTLPKIQTLPDIQIIPNVAIILAWIDGHYSLCLEVLVEAIEP